MAITRQSRTLVIGDIHGSWAALKTIEKLVHFNESDTVIALGDYIDRGPDSKNVLDWMIAARRKFNLIPLLGNHEEMMLDARFSTGALQTWMMNGGDKTLKSFGSDISGVSAHHWQFIKSCKLYHETDSHIFVHAGLEPNLPPEQQKSDVMCWLRFRDLQPHMSNKIIVCGHTPQRSTFPAVLPYGICIDTYAFDPKGFLTCLDINTGEYWQANDQGTVRKRILPTISSQP